MTKTAIWRTHLKVSTHTYIT